MIFKLGCVISSTLLLVGCSGVTGLAEPDISLTSMAINLPHATNKPEGKNEDYYDPQRTQTPLYDTSGSSSTHLGPYFRVKEFSHTGDVVFRYARIDGKLVTCLTRLRESIGHPIHIESAYRNWAYNTQLFREGQRASKKSYHMSGKAADIYVGKISSSEFTRTVYQSCGCGIGLGVGDSWYHVDTRGSPVRPWGYGRSARSRLASARYTQKQMCGGGSNDFSELGAALMDSTKKAVNAVSKTLNDLLKK